MSEVILIVGVVLILFFNGLAVGESKEAKFKALLEESYCEVYVKHLDEFTTVERVRCKDEG